MVGEELLAVALALGYVIFAIRQQRIAWVLAAVSAGLYLHIFATVGLYMEAGLQIFYILAALYGWWVWGEDRSDQQLAIQRWPIQRHAALLAGVLGLGAALGLLLARYTDAALPIPDSITTVAALLATWMVARKVLENWLWWIGIDLVSIGLYLDRDLALTAALFTGYVILATAGWFKWHQAFQCQQQAASK